MAGAADIQAGGAFVEIYAKMSTLDKGLVDAGKRIQAFGYSVQAISIRMMAGGVGILGSLLAASKAFADSGADLVRMSVRTGVAVETLSELQFALNQSGSSLGTFEGALDSLNGAVRGVIEGNADLAFAFAAIGVSVRDLMGLSPAERFFRVAEALSSVQGAANRAALAAAILGGAGRELLPFLAQGAEGMAALRRQAQSMGLVMSGPQAKAALELQQALSRLSTIFRALVNAVGAAVTPSFRRVAEVLAGAGTATLEYVRANQGLVVAVAGIAAAAVAVGALGLAIGVAFVALGGFIKLGALWFSTVAVMARNVGSLVYYFRNDLGGALEVSRDGIQQWLEEFRQAIEAAGSAIAGGDLAGAMGIITVQFRITWLRFMSWLTTAWNNLASGVAMALVDAWHSALQQMQRATSSFAAWFLRMFPSLNNASTMLAFQGGNATWQPDRGLMQQQQEMQRQIEQQRQQGNQAEEARLREQLRELQAEARRQQDDALWTEALRPPGNNAPSGLPTPDSINAMRQAITVRGTFSAFDLGDVTAQRMDQQQLRVMQQQLGILNQINQGVRAGGPAFA